MADIQPSQIPKLQSKEANYDGRPVNLPGTYRHKDTKEDFITSSDFDAGVAQADYLMSPVWKDAWSRVGDVPSYTELLARNRAQLIKDSAAEGSAKREEEADLAKAIAEAEASLAKTTKKPAVI